MVFKFDSEYIFLTYPQATIGHNELYNFLNEKSSLLWLRVCTEQHDDGNNHCHAVGKFSRRFITRDERCFDFEGFHPNIQPVRSVPRALTYVAKDGEFTDFGDIPSHTNKRSHAEALELAADPDEGKFLKACLEARIPFQYAKRFRELAFSDNSNTITEFQAQDNWMRDPIREKTLPENSCAVVIGPSGIGKSVWAKQMAPKPCLWVSHLDVLRMYRPDYHRSIIFDDMSFKHMPVQAQIHLTDWTDSRQIHCRYGYATIPAKTVKIFTCNEYPFETHPAIERRVTLINLY